MLSKIHFLLTYACTYQCDHCFLHCGPEAPGTFTLKQLKSVFGEIEKIGTIEMVYFEGGEAFLYYPLMLKGLQLASKLRLKTGIVTNGYWATTADDAEIWLKPLQALEVDGLSISDDSLHQSTGEDSPAKQAYVAAKRLGIPCRRICIEEPTVTWKKGPSGKDEPVIKGDVRFHGRAAEQLTGDLPRRPPHGFTSCPHEELEDPGRVHVDAYGNVHVCQGVSMGNMWKTPLSTLVRHYNARAHPVCGPLLAGGPAQLAREYGVVLESGYVDECHCCYLVRKALVDRFPEHLAPRQVYALK